MTAYFFMFSFGKIRGGLSFVVYYGRLFVWERGFRSWRFLASWEVHHAACI